MIMLSSTSDSDKSRRILSSQNGGTRGRIRDVSFSSFLDGTEESFILKLAESEEISKSHNPICCNDMKKAEENEIDVFNADKYFNGRVEEEETNNPHEFELYKLGTPRSISSKSSLNSRSSLLLQSTPQNQKSYKSNGFHKRSFFSKLGCSCKDKNSVDVDDQVGRISTSGNGSSGRKLPIPKDGDFSKIIEPQTKSCVTKELDSEKIGDLGIDINRGEDFRFPVMKSNRGEEDHEEDGRRKSLEVFGSDVPKPLDMSGLSVERRMNKLTWDGIDIEIPSKSSKLHNDDSDSDTSSDLFEIESLSTNPTVQYLTRQTSYAPSETSIDWSVVTASATDFTAMSDSEELTRTNSDRIQTIKDHGTNGKTRRNSGILSGCYNHKAVMVVGDAHRTTSDHQKSNSNHI